MGGRRILLVAGIALLAAATLAPPACATFHLIKIREVYPGSVASPDSGYVELQMYSSGQQFVKNHAVTAYNAEGTLVGTFTFPSSLANGANQQTILVGDSGVEAAFGVKPDLADAGFALAAAGGAACWDSTLDCVSWGAFAGSTPSATGSPADPLGIPDGKALRRTIAPGCPTLLEAADDSNDSATDFSDATPQPRNNASAIVEHTCTAPTAAIDTKPANPTNGTSASFTYHSTPAGASFECKLDLAAYAACSSEGITYAGPLADGSHTFQVRAKNEEGTGAAASYTWKVDTAAPTAIIDSHPEDPSSGASASFKYHASETGSTFECSLAAGAAPDGFSACASTGKTYTELADGDYTFKVRAKDAVGNQGSATAFEWTVENAIVDTTPPDTVIDLAPPDPATSSTVAFVYHSTEPGSTFECKLDAGAFFSCAATGIEYTGLAEGAHSFQVRAIDPSENVDPTPAGYSFEVVLGLPSPPPPAPEEPAPEAAPVPPNTRIVGKPRRRTRDRTPTLRFGADLSGASFQCTIDRARFRGCRSPYTTKRLRPGRHRFRVRAVLGGAVDPTPAMFAFKVLGGAKRKQRGKRRARATASTFHLVKVREVYPGSAANPTSEYVELQAYASGQNLVAGHTISLFGPGGSKTGSAEFTSDPPAGGNQVTFLAASAAAESQFGVLADASLPGGSLDPAGGAVCWEALDCVSWGSFKGSPFSPTGSPADSLGVPDGMALRRTIAPGCATLLEASDDRDDSATDFRDVFPAPRPNSTPPTEKACGSAGGPTGGGGSAGRRPQTRFRRTPGRVVRRHRVVFRFVSSRPGSTFLCKLDRKRFRRCRSPFAARHLRSGRHVFRVKARAPDGLVDRTPATWRFRVA